MASVLSNYFGNMLLNYLTTNGAYLGIFNDDPGPAFDPTAEISGTTRAAVTFSSPSGKAIASTNSQQITTTADDITFLGLLDAPVGGHLIATIELLAPLDASVDGFFLAAPGDVALQL